LQFNLFQFCRYKKRKEAKINQKDFLPCLVGAKIIQKNDCTTPPLLHTTNLLSSSMAVIKEPLGGLQDIFEEPQGKKKKKTFL